MLDHTWRSVLALLVSLGVSSSALAAPVAFAQTQSVIAPISGTDACVLHVWPGPDAKSSYSGWFHGGAVDGDKRGIKGYPEMHASALATSAQRALVERVDWSGQLDKPGLSVVIHDEPPVVQDDLTRKTALLTNRPTCYAEAIIHSVFVESEVFSAKTVRVLLIFKLWKGSSVPWTYSTMDTEKVRLDGEAAATKLSIKDGFVAAVTKSLHAGYFWH